MPSPGNNRPPGWGPGRAANGPRAPPAVHRAALRPTTLPLRRARSRQIRLLHLLRAARRHRPAVRRRSGVAAASGDCQPDATGAAPAPGAAAPNAATPNAVGPAPRQQPPARRRASARWWLVSRHRQPHAASRPAAAIRAPPARPQGPPAQANRPPPQASPPPRPQGPPAQVNRPPPQPAPAAIARPTPPAAPVAWPAPPPPRPARRRRLPRLLQSRLHRRRRDLQQRRLPSHRPVRPESPSSTAPAVKQKSRAGAIRRGASFHSLTNVSALNVSTDASRPGRPSAGRIGRAAWCRRTPAPPRSSPRRRIWRSCRTG